MERSGFDSTLSEMKSLELSAGTIHYRDTGRGRPIVFVHGLLVDGALWEPVAARLSDRFRCIVPDWPLGSHTTPMKADADLSPTAIAGLVGELLQALALDDVILVANDSGGAITQVLMTTNPARIGGVVLTTCDAFEIFPPKLFAFLHVAARAPSLLGLSAKLLRTFAPLRRLPTTYGRLTKRPIDDALVERWIAPARDPNVVRDVAKFLRGMSPTVTLDAAKHFADVEVPVLVAWAKEDPSFPMDLAERLVSALPHARLETIDDAWVFASLDQPARVAELVADFAS